MSQGDDKITESDLHAYADGVLSGPTRASVEAYLAENPAAAEGVDAWRRQNEALRTLYRHHGAEPVPLHLSAYRVDRERRAAFDRSSQIAAVAVLLVAIGSAAGWYGHGVLEPAPSAGSSLIAEATEAHRIYASEIVHPVEVWADERDHLQTWLSKRLDRVLTVPDLRADGLSLVGGRLLPAANGPAAQFMYEDEAGHRVTLYIIPVEEKQETTFRYATIGRLEAVFWTDEAISCALVGELPREELHQIATKAYEHLG